MSPTSDRDSADRLIAQIVTLGLRADSLPPLVEGLCEGLLAAGVTLLRAQAAMPARHALFDAQSATWRRGGGIELRSFAHGGRDQEPFRSSAFAHMLATGTLILRRSLADPETIDFPMLHELRAAGATDYYARLVGFGRDPANPEAATILRGMVISFSVDAPGGFTEADLALIERVLPAFALACFRVQLQHGTIALAGAYLGADAARRVLSGETQRGAVVAIEAALLVADLRGFTALADRIADTELVAALNDYLELIGAAVETQGGQILKFLGDGALATFAIGDAGDHDAVCARALAAGEAALAAVAARNQAREAAGEPALALDVALHVGRVMYGNVGARERLDFTVIGPAVNTVARIEPLCATLGSDLLMSAAFAARCGRPVRSLGAHAMRGLAMPQELFALA
jgi:adenylate cyclase